MSIVACAPSSRSSYQPRLAKSVTSSPPASGTSGDAPDPDPSQPTDLVESNKELYAKLNKEIEDLRKQIYTEVMTSRQTVFDTQYDNFLAWLTDAKPS